ncbi:MAG: hypothetical protein IJF78_09895 [Clostridia bacterium]|nr:hypothetical protein [Clostridia bacterium]
MTTSKKVLSIATAVIAGLLILCTVLSVIIRNQTQPVVETVKPAEEYVETEDGGMYLLHLPAGALAEAGVVYVVRSGIGLFGYVYHAEMVEVEVYERNGETVAVGSMRLSRHDEVIVRPVERMMDGCPVRVTESGTD